MADGMKMLTINRCARHNFYSVSIEDEFGGQRITPSKCCGSWSTVKQWALSADDWREVARLANDAAELASAPDNADSAWHDAVLAACMKIEGAYNKDNPTDTLNKIEEWWYQLGVEQSTPLPVGSLEALGENGENLYVANPTPAARAQTQHGMALGTAYWLTDSPTMRDVLMMEGLQMNKTLSERVLELQATAADKARMYDSEIFAAEAETLREAAARLNELEDAPEVIAGEKPRSFFYAKGDGAVPGKKYKLIEVRE